MALYLNFINVIVPITNIEKHFNVSFDVFFDSYSRDGRYKAMKVEIFLLLNQTVFFAKTQMTGL